MSNKDESLKEVGRGQAAALVEMVAALEVDYDRLEELHIHEECGNESFDADAKKELEDLREAAGECKDREEAETRIHEDALSVEVRGDWHTPGESTERAATEFQILLSTGGPASRIMGELDEHGEPHRAWLEVQDWGTPWTQYFDIEQDTLLTYARCFYFGEGG